MLVSQSIVISALIVFIPSMMSTVLTYGSEGESPHGFFMKNLILELLLIGISLMFFNVFDLNVRGLSSLKVSSAEQGS